MHKTHDKKQHNYSKNQANMSTDRVQVNGFINENLSVKVQWSYEF